MPGITWVGMRAYVLIRLSCVLVHCTLINTNVPFCLPIACLSFSAPGELYFLILAYLCNFIFNRQIVAYKAGLLGTGIVYP